MRRKKSPSAEASGRTRLARSAASLLLTAFLIAPAAAYEAPLDPHSIREAYFLGQRNDEKMARFLDTYVKHLPPPEKGPYISEIQLLTPYAQVVDLSRQKTVGYSAQQAEQDYRDHGDTIRVRVRIEFTATYGLVEAQKATRSGTSPGFTLRPEDFWKQFKVGLSQKDQWVEPLDTYGEPTYSLFNPGATGPVMNGALVYVEWNAADVSSSPANVEVFTPDGQHVVATFDLEKLR
jgi:hypothetical protein